MKILIILTLFFTISIIYSLDPNIELSLYQIDQFNTKNGLPQNSVFSLLQTKNGYIWFGTQGGLVKFDGKNFVNYNNNHFKNLKVMTVRSIDEEPNSDNIWFSSWGDALVKFNYLTGKYKLYTKKDGVLNHNIKVVKIDKKGRIWIIYDQESKISMMKNGEIKHFDLPKGKILIKKPVFYKNRAFFSIGENYLLYNDKDQLKKTKPFKEKIIFLYQLKSTKKYIAFGKKYIYQYDPEDDKYKTIFKRYDKKFGVSDVLEDSDKNIWVLTSDKKILRYRAGVRKIDKYKDILEGGSSFEIIEDHEKNIWIGYYYKGVYLIKESKISVYQTKKYFPKAIIFSLFYSSKRGFYAGTIGGGVIKYQNGKFVNLFPELKNDQVFSIDQDKDGNLWVVAFNKKLYKIDIENKIEKKHEKDFYKDVTDLNLVFIDSKNRVWLGTYKKGVYLFENDKLIKHFKIKGLVTAIKEIDDKFWIGSSGGGIIVVKDGKIEKKIDKNICGELIFSIYEENKNSIWFAIGNGICFYNGEKFFKFDKKAGVYLHLAGDIISDHLGDIWGGSNKGIFYIKKKEINNFIQGKTKKITFKLFGKKEGVIDPECNGGSQYNIFKYKNKIYIPTMGGIAVVDPEKIDRKGVEPPTYITKLKFDKTEVKIIKSRKLTIPAGTKNINFTYTALAFKYNKYVKFRYKLEGYDKNWVEADDRKTAYYTNLPPGDYKFKVIASNGDGVWNMEGDFIDFKILPLFSQTIWFTILQIFFAIFFVILIFGFKLWQAKKTRIKLQKLVDEQTKELREAALKLKEASLKDPLTQLKNRRFLTEMILPQLNRFTKEKKFNLKSKDKRGNSKVNNSYALYLCDIDHFKKVNDNYGHEAGDRVLKQFSNILKNCIRENDFVIRWGGEEFLVILKDTNSEKMDVFINRFRDKMNNFNFVINDDGDTIQKTCSVGYLKYPPSLDNPEFYSFEQAVMIADLGLYYSKKNGRNMGVKINILKTPDNEIKNRTLEDLDFGIEKGIYSVETVND